MALQDGFGIDGKTYSGQEMRLLVAGLTFSRGGVSDVAHLKATPNGTPDAKVQLAAGEGIIPATSGGTLGSYEVPNDAAGLQSPSFTATGASGRWDKLILQIVAGVPTLVIVQGTPAGSPAYPSLVGQNDYIEICGVKMPPSKSVIDNGTNGTIDDRRSVWMANVTCTSSTRPAVPFDGQEIYETDTDKNYRYDGTSFVRVESPLVTTSGNRPTGNDRYEGREIYETDTDTKQVWDGTQWVQIFQRDWTADTPNVRNVGQANVTRTVTYAKHTRVSKQITSQARLDITSNSAGSGNIAPDLPVDAATNSLTVGVFTFFDVSANFAYMAFALIDTSGTPDRIVGIRDNTAGATDVSTQLGTGDWVMWNVVYEASTF